MKVSKLEVMIECATILTLKFIIARFNRTFMSFGAKIQIEINTILK